MFHQLIPVTLQTYIDAFNRSSRQNNGIIQCIWRNGRLFFDPEIPVLAESMLITLQVSDQEWCDELSKYIYDLSDTEVSRVSIIIDSPQKLLFRRMDPLLRRSQGTTTLSRESDNHPLPEAEPRNTHHYMFDSDIIHEIIVIHQGKSKHYFFWRDIPGQKIWMDIK